MLICFHRVEHPSEEGRMQLLMFSKMLGGLSVEQAGEAIAEMGFDGVDLTVREGGHILPENAEQDLPKAVDLLRSKQLSVPMVTTGIVAPDEPHAEAILKSASECGVRYVKLGYWRYEGFGHVRAQVAEARTALKGLEALARAHNLCLGVHIHSGAFLSAMPGVMTMLLEGLDPQRVGAYIDPGHMALEGGRSGWEIGMDLLSDRIAIVAAKDFGWYYQGNKSWRWVSLPLYEGIVSWPRVFAHLRAVGFDGPVTVHSEYANLSTEDLIAQTKRDLAYLKQVMAS
jgi:sugar phosphate isomerase/epimerase